jgi:hypothetical protein
MVRRWAKFVLHWSRGALRRVTGPQMPSDDAVTAQSPAEARSSSAHGRFA